jgi:hypothetical protein
MTIKDLDKQQLTQVKQAYFAENHENMSYDDLEMINTLVSDEEIFEAFEGVNFVDDDFWKVFE